MKFLSLRTVYRVFPIIKHSKLWDHALSRPLVLLTWNFKHLFVSSSTINMPNFIEIGWEIREKSRDADGGKEKKERIKKTRLDQSNVLDWKVSSILLKTKFIVSHVMLKYRCRSSIWFCLCRFELNPTVNNGDMSIEKYYSVIPMQPEVPFSTTTVENWKWFGHELTELWIDKSNNKERICIYLAIDP